MEEIEGVEQNRPDGAPDALLAAMAAASDELVGVMDGDGQLIWLNPAGRALLGLPADTPAPLRFQDLVAPAIGEGVRGLLDRVRAEGRHAATIELWNVSSGETTPVHWRAVLLDDDRVGFWARDLRTERRHEAELQAVRERERHLLGMVGHDLRNPLQVVKISVNLLRAPNLAPERRPQVYQRIEAAAGQAERLIADLLDFTRLRIGGGMPLNGDLVDLTQVAREAIDDARVVHRDRALILSHSGPTLGRWDPQRVRQVVDTLLRNALRHGPPDRPVEVRVVGEPDAVRLEVHNAGEPIPEGLHDILFDPFERSARRLRGHGIGLSLYVARAIVAAHGGDIGFTSSAEAGTTFTARLPIDH